METTSLYNGSRISRMKSFRHFTKLRSEGVTMADIKQTASVAGTEVAAKHASDSCNVDPFILDVRDYLKRSEEMLARMKEGLNAPVRMETEGEKKARYAREQEFYKASLEEDEKKYRDYCERHPCIAGPCLG